MTQPTARKQSTSRQAAKVQRRELKSGVIAFKRASILEEASTLFFEKGYEGATLDMLAKRLSVTKPFLYTYFKNKGDILSAICELGVKESLVALERIAHAESDALIRLRESIREVAEIIIEHHEHLVVYQREMMNLERADAQRILRLRHEFDLQIAKLVQDCQRDGYITVSDATSMSVWIGGLLGWITSCYRPGGRRSREEIIDQVTTACLRLVGLDNHKK